MLAKLVQAKLNLHEPPKRQNPGNRMTQSHLSIDWRDRGAVEVVQAGYYTPDFRGGLRFGNSNTLRSIGSGKIWNTCS